MEAGAIREITIIGAGVAGLCVAVELLRAGARVRVLDRADGPGPAQCSWWAGGMLAPWCERESAEPEVLELGRGAADWWERSAGGVARRGTLVVSPARDRAQLSRFARRTSGFDDADADRIGQLEPDLAGRFRHGLFFPEEAHLDPRGALSALAETIVAMGGQIRYGEACREDGSEDGPTIDCRGIAARDRLADLRGVKGEMLLVRTSDLHLARPVRLLHPRHPIYVVPRGDGCFMIGATVLESAERSRVSVRSMLELLGAAYALHPAFGEAEILETGSDLRPAFPDNLPRVEQHGARIYVNGLYRHGFLLAPAMAARVGALALAEFEEMGA